MTEVAESRSFFERRCQKLFWLSNGRLGRKEFVLLAVGSHGGFWSQGENYLF